MLADLARSGDEPLMLARQLPGVAVLVSPNRHLAGRLAEARFGCDVHLLDDGFQHFVLERDVDLLVVGPDDVSRPLVLPFGRLREPLEVARAADAVLWTGEGDPADAAARLGVAHGFRLTHEAGAFTSAPFGGPLPAPGDRVIAMAAIARPERFVAALAGSGFNVASTMFLRDHHRYTPADLARAEREMRDANAVCIVTTEKDMVRLLPLRPLPFPLAWRRLTTRVEPARDVRCLARRPSGPSHGAPGACRVRDRIEYWAVIAARAVVSLLPISFVRFLGTLLGLTFYAVDAVHRRIADTNLVTAFPARSRSERAGHRAPDVRALRAPAARAAEVQYASPDQMRRVVEFEGEDRLRAGVRTGQGRSVLHGPLRVWELQAIVQGLKGEPTAVLARALDNPRLHALLEQVRTSTGNTVIYRQGAVRRVLKSLHARQAVAMLIDQHMHSPDAIYVDFFERPAATTSMLAALAMRTGAPVVPVFALPLHTAATG